MSNPVPRKINPFTYLLAAIIGAIALILAAALGNESVYKSIIEQVKSRTEKVTIYADKNASGTAIYYGGDYMLTFAESPEIVGAGDTSNDQFVRSFFTFYLGRIPNNATILEATIVFPCDVIGRPKDLGMLTLKEFDFGDYEQSDFQGIPSDTTKIWWSDTNQVIKDCQQNHLLSVETYPLVISLIQRKVTNQQPLQIVMYFQGEKDTDFVISNQSIDGILVQAYPSLYIRYRYLPP